ncbi:MAG: TRIC cation channel family protein [Caulobacterales bacterium]
METTLAILALIGVAVFAISGALVAKEENFDLIGALFLSIATAIGGGTIVDLLIGHTPVRWIETPTPLLIAGAAGLIAFAATSAIKFPHAALLWADAAGLAVFTATGMERLTSLQLHPIVCVFLAAIGGAGGGILRDVLANRTPIVFSPETELYVTGAFAGGAAYLATDAITNQTHAPLIAALIVTGAVRAAGIIFGLRLGPRRT